MTEEYNIQCDKQVVEQINYLGPGFTSKIIKGENPESHHNSSHCLPMHNFSEIHNPYNFNQMLHIQQIHSNPHLTVHHLNQYPYNLGQQYIPENTIQIKNPIPNPPNTPNVPNLPNIPMKMQRFAPISNSGENLGNVQPVNFVSSVPIPPGKKFHVYPTNEQISPNCIVFKSYQQRVWNEIVQIKNHNGTPGFKLVINNDIQPIWIVCNKDKFTKWLVENNIVN
jgi:hypothetical protein